MHEGMFLSHLNYLDLETKLDQLKNIVMKDIFRTILNNWSSWVLAFEVLFNLPTRFSYSKTNYV